MDIVLILLTTMTALLTNKIILKYSPFIALTMRKMVRKIQGTAMIMNEEKSPPRVRIYTRTGDSGSSALFTGERRPKDDVIFEALGSTDELSCSIGLAKEFITQKDIYEELEKVQCIIQDLQSAIATPRNSARESQIEKTKWDINHLVDLENWIDRHSDGLPPLKNFILPSGGKASAHLHVARSICRRAERRVVPLLDEGVELPILQYLNRLSSYLFTVGRVCAMKDGYQETIYRRVKSSDPILDD